VELTARNINVEKLLSLLEEQQARKVDVVLPARNLTAVVDTHGQPIVKVEGVEPSLSSSGVSEVNGDYEPLDTFHGHVAEKLNVPPSFLRRMAADRPDVWTDIINGLLHGSVLAGDDGVISYPEDPRSFLFRGFRAETIGDLYVARGLMSNKYRIVDHLDVFTATIEGAVAASEELPNGLDLRVVGADVSGRRMYVRFLAPAVEVAVDALLQGYRDPFANGQERRAGAGGWGLASRVGRKALWAGVEVTNSELGFSKTKITPRAELLVCMNGQKVVEDVVETVHLGGKLDDGVIEWSDETQRKALELVRAKTKDAVVTFLNPAEWTTKAGKPVKDVQGTITAVANTLNYSDAERDTILRHFILGGQVSAGGVMNAITSAAQTVEDPDRASALEDTAIRALDLV
jgi:hypothetical protein